MDQQSSVTIPLTDYLSMVDRLSKYELMSKNGGAVVSHGLLHNVRYFTESEAINELLAKYKSKLTELDRLIDNIDKLERENEMLKSRTWLDLLLKRCR